MERLEKKEYLNRLFELYKRLLTEKQRETFIYYYVDDYSLQEIAEIFHVSRNAIFDQLKKVEQHLNDYEENRKLPALKMIFNCIDGNEGPLIHDFSEPQQDEFDSTCRKFYKFLKNRKE